MCVVGELASAIVRRNSIGRDANLSIDERIAQGKQQKESEPQSELLSVLNKRKVSSEQSADGGAAKALQTDTTSPTEKQPVVFENANVATSSQEDNEVYKFIHTH